MNTIDKTLEYHELLMTYEDTSKYIKFDLPKGYHYEFYKKGDEKEWVNIHISSGEFANFEKGLEYFHQLYDSFIDELDKRCIFIINDKQEKVGTATISLLTKKENEFDAAVDWLAIKKEYQGKKLARPLISKIIELSKSLGHDKLILHTQTHTWLAAKLYLDMGFVPYKMQNNYKGWQILKILTNHKLLDEVLELSDDEMHSNDMVLIYKKLKEIFVDNFSYSVWYIDRRNDVYVTKNNEYFIYKFYIKNGEVILENVER